MDVDGWRAYYPDGSTVDSSESSPAALDDGTVGLVIFFDECQTCNSDKRYRDIITGGDWYLWSEDGGWSHVPTHPIHGRWVQRFDVEEQYDFDVIVKSAPEMDDNEWEELRSTMLNDREVP